MEPIPPEALLADAPPPMREIAEWLRDVVRRTLPEAEERVRTGWGVIGYDIPVGRRRTAFIAWLWAQPEHVHFGFPHGILLEDPDGRLEGTGITKRARWVTLTPGERLPESTVAALLREAARVSSLPPGEQTLLRIAHEEAEAQEGRGRKPR